VKENAGTQIQTLLPVKSTLNREPSQLSRPGRHLCQECHQAGDAQSSFPQKRFGFAWHAPCDTIDREAPSKPEQRAEANRLETNRPFAAASSSHVVEEFHPRAQQVLHGESRPSYVFYPATPFITRRPRRRKTAYRAACLTCHTPKLHPQAEDPKRTAVATTVSSATWKSAPLPALPTRTTQASHRSLSRPALPKSRSSSPPLTCRPLCDNRPPIADARMPDPRKLQPISPPRAAIPASGRSGSENSTISDKTEPENPPSSLPRSIELPQRQRQRQAAHDLPWPSRRIRRPHHVLISPQA